MAVVVIATPGAVDANSFQTVAEIDAYFVNRAPVVLWSALSADLKGAAAITATMWMTALIMWTGYVASPGVQVLPWPRNSMWYRDDQTIVPSTIIPRELKNAHAEFSWIMANTDRTLESEAVIQGLTSLRVSTIAMTFREWANNPPIIPSNILKLLVPSWVDYVSDGSSGERELVRT